MTATDRTRFVRRLLVVLGGVGASLLAAYGVSYAGGDVPAGVRVAGTELGGLSRPAAREAVQELQRREQVAFTVVADGERLPFDPVRAGLSRDVEATLGQAFSAAPVDRVLSLAGRRRDIGAVVLSQAGRLEAEIARLAGPFDRTAREGAVRFEGLVPVADYPVTGRTLQQAPTAKLVQDRYLRYPGVQAPVTLDPVHSTRQGVDRVLTGIARPAVAAPITLTAGGRPLVVQPADIAAALTFPAGPDGSLSPSLDGARLRSALGKRVAAVETRPRDAGFAVRDGRPVVVPAVDGRVLVTETLAATVSQLLRRAAPRAAELPLRNTPAKRTTQQAQDLDINELVGTFTTRHPCCLPRVENIHRIADLVDGTVVLPGEVFDLNAEVGPRDKARGFVEAPQILKGEFVDRVGGGVSQFATTLFNAVFFGGLEDVEHQPHSYYISRYPPGREATVSYPKPDLIFRNDSPDGVLVDTRYTGTSITVDLYGTKRFDIEAEEGERTRIRPFTTQYVDRPDCTATEGEDGFDIEVTRVFSRDGRQVRRQEFSTRYLPEPNFICGPPPPGVPATPSPSPSPSATR